MILAGDFAKTLKEPKGALSNQLLGRPESQSLQILFDRFTHIRQICQPLQTIPIHSLWPHRNSSKGISSRTQTCCTFFMMLRQEVAEESETPRRQALRLLGGKLARSITASQQNGSFLMRPQDNHEKDLRNRP